MASHLWEPSGEVACGWLCRSMYTDKHSQNVFKQHKRHIKGNDRRGGTQGLAPLETSWRGCCLWVARACVALSTCPPPPPRPPPALRSAAAPAHAHAHTQTHTDARGHHTRAPVRRYRQTHVQRGKDTQMNPCDDAGPHLIQHRHMRRYKCTCSHACIEARTHRYTLL